ncbi:MULTISPECIES: hypothetical protein [unclassified Micromonospora]
MATSGETCTNCGERFGNGMDILRSAPSPVIGGAPISLPHGWHVGCC